MNNTVPYRPFHLTFEEREELRNMNNQPPQLHQPPQSPQSPTQSILENPFNTNIFPSFNFNPSQQSPNFSFGQTPSSPTPNINTPSSPPPPPIKKNPFKFPITDKSENFFIYKEQIIQKTKIEMMEDEIEFYQNRIDNLKRSISRIKDDMLGFNH
jgi:hypothetical protein